MVSGIMLVLWSFSGQEFEARVGVSYWLANRLASGLHSRFSKLGLRFQFFRLKT